MGKNDKIQCPACGSYNVDPFDKEGIAQAVFGPVVSFKETLVKCKDCGSSFANENDGQSPYTTALEQSKKESVTSILGSLSQLGCNYAAMERALELPQRTLSRWKSGADPSAAGTILLRFINTYPWLVEVADAKYDKRVSNELLIKNAIAAMSTLAFQAGYIPESIQVAKTNVGISVEANYRRELTINLTPSQFASADSFNQLIGATV